VQVLVEPTDARGRLPARHAPSPGATDRSSACGRCTDLRPPDSTSVPDGRHDWLRSVSVQRRLHVATAVAFPAGFVAYGHQRCCAGAAATYCGVRLDCDRRRPWRHCRPRCRTLMLRSSNPNSPVSTKPGQLQKFPCLNPCWPQCDPAAFSKALQLRRRQHIGIRQYRHPQTESERDRQISWVQSHRRTNACRDGNLRRAEVSGAVW
jgi:hypothetical protein